MGTSGNRNTAAGAFGRTGKSLEDALARFRNQNKTVLRPGQTNIAEELKNANRIRKHCISYLLDAFFRERHKDSGLNDNMNETQAAGNTVIGNALHYQESSYFSEQETTSFSTTGKVVTSDGREISFQLELEMSRSFETYYEKSYTQNVVFCDPLVINLDGDIAEVSDQKFLFDLDCDGEEESISCLRPGSGYLALDKNGDGIMNDGSELFGAKSGDGFADLMRYDEDGNGWIDENDEIFHKLVIWSKDEQGNDVMYKLADKGVGAICLQNVSTEFGLHSKQDNSTNALIRKTGIFLYENGGAGTVQHLDMAT